MSRVLVVDRDPMIVNFLTSLLGHMNHEVAAARSGDEARSVLVEESIDLVIAEFRTRLEHERELLDFVQEEFAFLPVIVLADPDDVAPVLRALKNGAFDVVPKPLKMDIVRVAIEHALEYGKTLARIMPKTFRRDQRAFFDELIAESSAMKHTVHLALKAAQADTPLLIRGDPGTGRESLAEAIHRHSPRRKAAFVVLDASTIDPIQMPSHLFGFSGDEFEEGIVGLAHGGTLYIENIELVTPDLQEQLLTAIRDKRMQRIGSQSRIAVDFRLIAATSKSIDFLGQSKMILPELWNRLCVITIAVPPLRRRTEDIVPLFLHYVTRIADDGKKHYDLDVMARLVLQNYTWPGNLDELRRVAAHAVQHDRDGLIEVEDLPENLSDIARDRTLVYANESDPEQHRGAVAKAFLQEKQKAYVDLLKQKRGPKP